VSWRDATDPVCVEEAAGAVSLVLQSKPRDLGGFEVRRVLPSSRQRSVGPFVFLDQMGPVELVDRHMEVRPHPHIGLATVTYLFSGAITHRDSLGSTQVVCPGEVGWMTAGRGIVHSERTSDAGNAPGAALYGLQTWVALRREREEREPAFAHHEAGTLPAFEEAGLRGRLVLGEARGLRSPVVAESDPFYVELRLDAGARWEAPREVEERAVYVVSGRVRVGDAVLPAGTLGVVRRGSPACLEAVEKSLAMVLGGAALDGPRFMWWNFVSTSKERIEQAKADWKAQRFLGVPGDSDFVPLPD
jgi:redox-sensitive bicupin YhaK (pirin superfamily)